MRDFLKRPIHPYTVSLLRSLPSMHGGGGRLPAISAVSNIDPDVRMNFDLGGEVADAGRLPLGCSFHPRCPYRFGLCDKIVLELLSLDGLPRAAACHLHDPRQ